MTHRTTPRFAALGLAVAAALTLAAAAPAAMITIEEPDFETSADPTALFNNTAWETDSTDISSDFNFAAGGKNQPTTGGNWLELENNGVQAWQKIGTVEALKYTMAFNLTSNTGGSDYVVGLWADTDDDGTPDESLVEKNENNDGLGSYGFGNYPGGDGWERLTMEFDGLSNPLPGSIAAGDDLFVYATRGAFNNMAIDDLEVTAVPEPATLALLGLGGAVMLSGRKRRHA